MSAAAHGHGVDGFVVAAIDRFVGLSYQLGADQRTNTLRLTLSTSESLGGSVGNVPAPTAQGTASRTAPVSVTGGSDGTWSLK